MAVYCNLESSKLDPNLDKRGLGVVLEGLCIVRVNSSAVPIECWHRCKSKMLPKPIDLCQLVSQQWLVTLPLPVRVQIYRSLRFLSWGAWQSQGVHKCKREMTVFFWEDELCLDCANPTSVNPLSSPGGPLCFCGPPCYVRISTVPASFAYCYLPKT